MKTLICTNCLKTVSVADAAPGTDVKCPECGKDFSVPAAYTPAVASNPVPLVMESGGLQFAGSVPA